MSNVRRIDGNSVDAIQAGHTADSEGIESGMVLGYDKDGRVCVIGFGGTKVADGFFMVEAFKHNVLTGANE
ncbi:hypothetical protein [Xanthomonas phage Suba]|uniref:Uncharacterized protein n=1 Tax=Xanthomonas phage Suba TaxID=2674975 RepID=A0A679KAS9_9CAUD|nr:hypothetical protein QAY88_gp50 [Xanthomonas phage Suba]CAA2409876.1 hypothetical protein [Xanthomonas phage Suba]